MPKGFMEYKQVHSIQARRQAPQETVHNDPAVGTDVQPELSFYRIGY
jgi:hypothetical protein